jgi:adenine-specific DNA-methyltransferase
MGSYVSPMDHTGKMRSQEIKLIQMRQRGAVYTPYVLATWLANQAKELGCRPRTVIDPAAGDGMLLKCAQSVFLDAQGVAYEIDKECHSSLKEYWPNKNARAGDALVVEDWFMNQSSEVLLFSNPPWGANINAIKDLVYRKKFESAVGHYDTYDLFIEKTLRDLPANSWAALFLPDSILLEQHKTIRRLLSEKVQIKAITRLPDGAFEGVSMGSIAIIIKNSKPRKNSKIKVSRISREVFMRLKNDLRGLTKEIENNSHIVEQQRWTSDPNTTWSMEFKGFASLIHDLEIFKKSNTDEIIWNLWFKSGRGIEIGKKSSMLKPLLGREVSDSQKRVAVGEDVHRLRVEPSRSISVNRKDVDFKSEAEDVERILVRKTGIGIKAVVAKGIATTQTIYHFEPLSNAPRYALHYAAGFLISRVTIALHLARTGDTEWRTHPYVTQKTIKDINLPLPEAGSHKETLAKQISKVSKKMHKVGPTPELELELDKLVCELIGAPKELIDWTYKFLADIKGCKYTKMLVKDVHSINKAA